MKKLILINFLIVGFCIGKVYAQVDPHFSQYYAYPLWLNPALTGVMDGDMRVTANAKDQWAGISNGYRTMAFSGDMRTSEKLSVGLNVLDQTAGSAGYNYLAAYGSVAYQVAISSSGYQKLNFGVQAGIISRSYNANKLQLDDQYTPGVGYDPSVQSSDSFIGTNSNVFDASAGVFYYNGDPSSNINFFAGASASHLAPAKDQVTGSGINERMPFRYTLHGGFRIKASPFADITPHAMYVHEQSNQIIAAGANAEFRLREDYSFIVGGMYRVNDAAVANTGFHIKNLIIGVSYDFNNSPLRSAIAGQGGYEMSLSYVFTHRLSSREQICPRF